MLSTFDWLHRLFVSPLVESPCCILLTGSAGNQKHYPLTETNLRFLYWTPYQQLAHHAAAGCGMETGDILGSGTISGEVRTVLILMIQVKPLTEFLDQRHARLSLRSNAGWISAD